MYKIYETAKLEKVKMFDTEDEAISFVKRQKKAKNFYTMEEVIEQKPVAESTTEVKPAKRNVWNTFKNTIDFTDAVEVTRDNVKNFYHKTGFIQIVNQAGKTLHIGRTTNMGKVFSNYVNCARYNQSYDFNLMHGDKLYFKEQSINY